MTERTVACIGVGVWLTLAGTCWIVIGFKPGPLEAQTENDTRRSTRDGVYTREQAERGAMQYELYCEHCHLPDLGGNQIVEAPSLIRDAFLARWERKTAGDLFETISTTMPADDPGRLSRRAYVDIVSFILHVNRFPVGDRELDRDPGLLRQVIIEGLAADRLK